MDTNLIKLKKVRKLKQLWKFRKWKFTPFRKMIVSRKKLLKLIKAGKTTIYDTRADIDFKKGSYKTSINISKFNVKREIKKHNLKDRIILIGEFERTEASNVSWARNENYKHIKLGPTFKKDNKK